MFFNKKMEICRLCPKVFCIGLNKTGTTSFGDAMELLQYKRLGWNEDSYKLVNAYFEGDFETLYKAAYTYNALEDIPWPLAYKEMDRHFPNAKFVLTIRKSSEKWLESITNHIRGPYEGHRLIYGHHFPEGNEQAFIKKYEQHNSEVTKYFKDRPNKLLTMCFENGDGWDKLLPFIGLKGIPNRPWPHSNKSGKANRSKS